MSLAQLNTKYEVEPSVLTNISSMLQKTLQFESLAMRALPDDMSLEPFQQMYEWSKVDEQTGVGYEIDPVSPPGAQGDIERKQQETPVLYTNITFSFDQFQRIRRSRYSLQDRILDHRAKLVRRADAISYMGDTKYGVNALGTATPGTEITTALNTTTVALINSTFGTAFNQLKTAVKHMGVFGRQSNVNIEVTPDIATFLNNALSQDQDFNGLEHLQKIVRAHFGPGSQVIENYMLAGSVAVNSAGIGTITEGNDTVLIYFNDPRIMKLVTSPMVIRQSPLDETRGITFQPIQRLTRVDVEPLGVLVETNVTTA